jgi:hypothetical protein
MDLSRAFKRKMIVLNIFTSCDGRMDLFARLPAADDDDFDVMDEGIDHNI